MSYWEVSLYSEPDRDAVIHVARSLGINLGRDEAETYCEKVVSRLNSIEEFMRLRVDEERPPLLAAERAPGYRPSATEDPFNAWLWKCNIRASMEGPLAGTTVSFKDHTAVASIPLTLGSHLLDGFLADFDATIATRVLAAGGAIIGKNSLNGPTSDWGWGVPGDYARPLNPHRPDHCTGGSSSGSAVAVAAGEVDISFGGDQGGSIRIPAALCGTYGLKPTFGLVSHFGIGFGTDQSIDHAGPLGRHAEDVAAALDAVAGYDPYDARQDRTVPASINSCASLAQGVTGVRIGVLEEGFVGATPDVRDTVTAAVDVMKRAGAKVTKVSVPEHDVAGSAGFNCFDVEGARAVFDVGIFGAFARTYYPAAFIAAAYRVFHDQTDRLRPNRKLNLIVSEFARRRFHGTVYAKAQNMRQAFTKAYDKTFDRVDVLVMPTCLDVAPKYEEHRPYLDAALQPRPYARNTRPFNYTGHPAITVPCGKSAGLPIGMQLVGRYYEDPLLLRTAYAFEHSVDWGQVIGLESGAPSNGGRNPAGANVGADS